MTTLEELEARELRKPSGHEPADRVQVQWSSTGLTFKEIKDYVARFTYKPGWLMWVEGVPMGDVAQRYGYRPGHMCRLVVEGHVVNAMRSDAHLDFTRDNIHVARGHCDLPIGISRDCLDKAIRWFIEYREIHELREWLKRDGRPVDFPPH